MQLDGEQLCSLANMGYTLHETNIQSGHGDALASIVMTFKAISHHDQVLLLPHRQNIADVLDECMGCDPVELLTKIFPLLKV